MEITYVKALRANWLFVVLAIILVLPLKTSALSSIDDEALAKRASQILGPLPESMPASENPITP